MTQIQHVTAKEMLRRTGANALGYTYPDKDLILLRKGLTGKTKQNVLAHEQEHLRKGEEGPLFGIDDAIIGGGLSLAGSLFGGDKRSDGASDALDFQRAAQAQTREDLTPYRDFGTNSLSDYGKWKNSREGSFRFIQPGYELERKYVEGTGPQGLSYGDWSAQQKPRRTTGQKRMGYNSWLKNARQADFTMDGGSTGPSYGNYMRVSGADPFGDNPYGKKTLTPADTSQEAYQKYLSGLGGTPGHYEERVVEGDFRTDPAYQFRRDEGMNTIQNSAIAKGGLLSGNALRAINEFGQNLASTEYEKIYNREYERQLREYLTDYQRKFGDVNLGFNAATGGAALNQAASNNVANAAYNLGNVQGNTYDNVFSGLAGAYGEYSGNKKWQDFLDRAYG